MKNYTLTFLALGLLIFTSCEDDEPDTPIIPNEEEVITTVTYTLINTVSGDTLSLYFQDLDDGSAPTIVTDTLEANASYIGMVSLLNDLASPPEDITLEVIEEDDEHQLFYIPSMNNISVAYADADDNGNPLGIETNMSTTNAGSGTLTIILRHEPNKFAEGVPAGDIANAGGETDIEVVFNVVVE